VISHFGSKQIIIAVLASAVALPATAEEPAFDPTKIDLVDAINCKLQVPEYNGFAMSISGEESIAAARKWRPVKSANFMMNEYDLPVPIKVADTYTTSRIAFTSNSILAILDLADPAIIATKEGIENGMDAEPFIKDMVASGKVTRAEIEKQMTFRKFLGEKIIVDRTTPAAKGESFGDHVTVARVISNATTHPGKTFYGCAYRMEIIDKDGKPI
jgi:hypothetical protein